MKRILLVFVLAFLTGFYSFSQGLDVPVGNPDANKIGVDTAQQKLKDITISQFEEAGYWYSSIGSDIGMISLRKRIGAPEGKAILDKERLEDEASVNAPPGKYVMGVKVKFYRRALSNFSVFPVRPIPIAGKCKTISLWAVGRNFNHRMKIVIEDYFGIRHELTMGKLNFLGWKKMTVAVPPIISQADYHHTSAMGIKFVGLKVYCDLMESFGTFYIYFDDLSAVTDLFEELKKDADDIPDDW